MDPHQRSLAAVTGSLLGSLTTLVCCVLPAVLVTLGAGATLVGLLRAFPQLVWLSIHKEWVFAVAGLLLAIGGIALLRARHLPCPVDPDAARACKQLRRASAAIYAFALLLFSMAVAFADLL
jgi:hypothetical protein